MQTQQGFEYNSRIYRNRDHAAAVYRCHREINRGRERLLAAIGPITTKPAEAPAAAPQAPAPRNLMSEAQAAAVGQVQKLARQITSAARAINHLNAAYELDLPPLLLSELSTYLMETDQRIRAAKTTAKQMQVKPVTEHLARAAALQTLQKTA